MVRKVVGMAVEKTEEVIKPSAVAGTLAFENDTIYPVIIVDHNGTRTLDPGRSQDNYLVNGFSVDLTLKISDTNEATKNFLAKEFKDRTLKMSKIFADHIMDLHRTNARDAWSEFKLNPGSQEEEEEEETVSLSPSCPFEQKFKSKTRQLIVNIFYRSGPLTKKCGSFEITSITVVSSLSCRPGRAKNVWNLAVTSTKFKHTDLRILKWTSTRVREQTVSYWDISFLVVRSWFLDILWKSRLNRNNLSKITSQVFLNTF